jgi:hypothetical protein
MADEGTKKALEPSEPPEPSPIPAVLAIPSRYSKHGELTVLVNPGRIHIGSDSYRLKKIEWINATGDEVKFTFHGAGSAKFFKNPPSDRITIEKDGTLKATVKKDGILSLDVSDSPPKGRHEYHVDCKATHWRPAQGNSEPEISHP